MSILLEEELSYIEKIYCNYELEKYLNNPIDYKIPNLDKIIDNGDDLKKYIEAKIKEYNNSEFKEKVMVKKSISH